MNTNINVATKVAALAIILEPAYGMAPRLVMFKIIQKAQKMCLYDSFRCFCHAASAEKQFLHFFAFQKNRRRLDGLV